MRYLLASSMLLATLLADRVLCETMVLTNGGFEVAETTGGALPTTFSDWSGDSSAIVTTENGIAPGEGIRMLHLISSTLTGEPPFGGGSNVWQLIDMSPFSAEILGGTATFSASAQFNRVLGDDQTDTQFELRVRAYAGNPADFPTQNKFFLSEQTATLFSDGDTSTWETALLSDAAIPTGADYLALVVRATENVFDDDSAPELDGHYVDAVSLSIGTAVPEPSSLVGLASLGLLSLGLLAWRQRRVWHRKRGHH